jgi:hypothetical protein
MRRSSWPVIVVACLVVVAVAVHRLWTNPLPESRDALLDELHHDWGWRRLQPERWMPGTSISGAGSMDYAD